MSFPRESQLPPVYYVQHHRTHASNGFLLSPFKDAAILTCDWKGELESMTMSLGHDNSIKTLNTQHMPNSLGLFYATFTEYLGYRPDNDEWKVMALSAFDVDCDDFAERIRSTFKLTDNGTLQLDQSYYNGACLEEPKLYTAKFIELFGGIDRRLICLVISQ